MVSGSAVDLSVVKGAAVDSGVRHGDDLLAFADAVMAADAGAISKARDVVEDHLGREAVSEAAGVIAMFNVVDRIADATGIPIDEGFTREMRYGIGDELGMAELSPEKRASR